MERDLKEINMYFKYLTIMGVMFLLSCGGGSSSSTDIPSGASGNNTGQITDQLQIVE